MVNLLVGGGADLEAEARFHDDSRARTPLLWAAKKGRGNIVEYLLSKGANSEFKDFEGTSLAQAAGSGNACIVDQLLHHGANLSFQPRQIIRSWRHSSSLFNEDSPLAMAASDGHMETAKSLINHGVEVLKGRPYEEQEQWARWA